MILIAGIPTEPPVEMAVDAAEESGVGYVLFDQREHASCDLVLDLDPFAGWRATLSMPSGVVDLSKLSGAYVRLMDEHFLPDVREEADDAPARARAIAFHALLHSWFDIAPGRIANRPSAMASNMSKTYQANIIRRCGFQIPETLVTNDPGEALRFVSTCRDQQDDVIYKSVSGARSIVQTFEDDDRERLHLIRWCPTQFQRKVRGQDVRVHVVGDSAIAVAVRSDATDYRYARRQTGTDAELEFVEIPAWLTRACTELSDALDLPFCGIDLRRTEAGGYVCFEVNPSPAYSYYESMTGVPIALTLVRWLSGLETVGRGSHVAVQAACNGLEQA